MRKFAAVMLVCTLTQMSCASITTVAPGPDTDWLGTISFNGEFSLEVFGKPGCISGALPLEDQRNAALLGTRVVRVRGSLIRWPSDPELMFLNHRGSHIFNECGGSHVIYADSIEEMD